MINTQEIQESDYSLFGKKSFIKGDLQLVGTTHIHSTIEGDITHLDGSTLILEFHSQVRGNINATNVIIMGSFDGNITAQGKVIIQPTAHVIGNIKCDSLLIQPGAFVEVTADAELSETEL